jgi:hypothetical protein
LNAQQCARVASDAHREIERWKASVSQAKEARQQRISPLLQIL